MTTVQSPSRVVFERDDDLRRLASARRDRVRFVHVPETRYLAVDGTEVPGSDAYQGAISALYGTAYRLHFALKARGVEGRVGHLEGLYWLPPEELIAETPTDEARPMDWRWRLLIAVPDEATEDDVDAAIRAGEPSAFLTRLYLDRWAEGPSAQILHVGPYSAERPALARLHAAIEAAGLKERGAHHEIYLNDPRRVGDERTRTLLRQPVEA